MKPSYKKIRYKGKKITLYSSGILRAVLDITYQTLHNWEKQRIMPPPILQPKGSTQRWYTANEILLYREANKHCMIGGKNKVTKKLKDLKQNFSRAYFHLKSSLKDPDKVDETLPEHFHVKTTRSKSLKKAINDSEKEKSIEKD